MFDIRCRLNPVTDLYCVNDREIDPAAVPTRLGADSERILPAFVTADGQQWLDAARTEPLPMPAPDRKQLDRATVAHLIRVTVQAPSRYLTHDAGPAGVVQNPSAAELRLLPHPVSRNGDAGPYVTGRHTFCLGPRLGLVRERAS
ncbi:hypothetical protein OG266_38100 [Streptomyces sp. NBC_00554]|uniref:hypothetical protein n=1 Tax=Streptomyces sp. NBC_00554 TaxID=2903661 RepID=UPI00352E0C1A|nr:hypothetical protein OG266_38100 [Streptomyces sp. NBC_00554]